MSEILGNITQVIRDVVHNKTLVVKPESLLLEDLGLESIDLLDISSELENGLGWELDFKEVAEFAAKKSGGRADMKTVRVQDLISFIESKS